MAKPTRLADTAEAPTAFYTLVGLNYWANGAEKRVEAGNVITDLPAAAHGWMQECSAIRVATDDEVAAAAKEVA
jgi:hypothetical protein